MRQPRLFISSSKADRSFTGKLADYLRRAYDEVWFDPNRYGGEVWWEEILWNIKACDIFIYLLSPASLEAPYCRAEYAEAQRLRKQVLPVVIRPHATVPPELADLNPLDMSRGLTAANLTELLATLKHLESRFPKAPPVPTRPEPTPMPLIGIEPPRRMPRAVKLGILVILAAALMLALFLSVGGPGDRVPASPTPTPDLPTATDTATTAPTFTGTAAATETPIPPTSTPTPTATIPTATNTNTVPPTVTRRAPH